MGFFEKLFGRKGAIEPFPENQSDAEKLNWFRKTHPWNRVDEKIINAIIIKYNGNPMIVAFIFISIVHNLIPMYCKYNNSKYADLDSPDPICSLIASILHNIGSSSLKQLIALLDDSSRNQEKIKMHYSTVLDSFESCIILDENHVSAYYGLAMFKGICNNSEDVLKYANQGLVAIQKIRANKALLHLSKHENTRAYMQATEEMENSLNQLITKTKNV